jgi:phage baseplate assembly protein W
MADAWCEWNTDFQVSASGGLLLADGDDLARQRIVRRLCTAVQGYVWHPEYGAGLPQRIGRPGVVSTIKAIVVAQMTLEAAVAHNPPPVVAVTQDANNRGAFVIAINYVSAANGEPITLSFTP